MRRRTLVLIYKICRGNVARAGDLTRTFRWITRRGQTKHLALPRGWLDVPSALALAEPDTSWMRQPTSRRRFTRWVDS